MSLEIELQKNTAALHDLCHLVSTLTSAIGAMQAPMPVSSYADVAKDRSGGEKVKQAEEKIIAAEVAAAKEATTSGEQSQPTLEPSSPALDYDRDVKTITLALSKAKGPETTKAILAKFDVTSAKQLVAGQWADYIAACNEALKW